MTSIKEEKGSWLARKLRRGGGSKKQSSTADDSSAHPSSPTPSTSTSHASRVDQLPAQELTQKSLSIRTSTTAQLPTASVAAPPLVPQPLDDSRNDDSTSQDMWASAYLVALRREPELMADYNRHLAGAEGAQGPLSSETVEAVVKKLIDDREQKKWHVSLLGKDVVVRKLAEDLAKFLIWSNKLVEGALSTQPYAVLAWSAVSMFLPLLTSGSKQHEAMLEGFSLICHTQLYLKVCEDNYLDMLKKQPNSRNITDGMVTLYSYIFEFQARVICHLSRSQLARSWQKVAGWNDWSAKAKEVETMRQRWRELIPPAQETELRDNWNRQLEVLHKSQETLDEIRSALADTGYQMQRHYEDQKERSLLQDIVSDYERGKNFNPKRVPGTCEWFFKDELFCNWRDSKKSSLLWVSAGPGCGKSVLSRCLIDDGRLSTNVTTSTICYFFFKDGQEGRMDGADAFSAILHQLFSCDSTGNLIEHALNAHKKFGRNLSQNFSELWRILRACTQSSGGGDIICVLDALDECNQTSREQIINVLRSLYSLEQHENVPKLSFLITSRPYDDLEASFGSFSTTTAYMRFDGDDKSDEISDEIGLVVDARLEELAATLKPEDRRKISDRLKSMENRTYLWLHLTFSIIEQKRSKYSKRAKIEELLDDLPSKVSDAYEKILDRSQDERETEILLQLVLAAVRPLTLDEANIALTFALQGQFPSHIEMESEMWPRESFKTIVRNLCGLFISVYDSKLYFIHQTAREFLTATEGCTKWKGRLNMRTSHETVSRSCLHYLLLSDFSQGIRISKHGKFPFFHYAAAHWVSHFKSQRPVQEITILEMARVLCHASVPRTALWVGVYRTSFFTYGSESWGGWSDLALASWLGLSEFIDDMVIKEPESLNPVCKIGKFPLLLATVRGHETVIRQLLENGAEIEATDENGDTPLLVAVLYGHEAVVRQLLKNGAKIKVTYK